MVGHNQYHLAVAGGCKRSAPVATRARWLRTHPLPRGGTDCVQVKLTYPRYELETGAALAPTRYREVVLTVSNFGEMRIGIGTTCSVPSIARTIICQLPLPMLAGSFIRTSPNHCAFSFVSVTSNSTTTPNRTNKTFRLSAPATGN